MLSLIEKLEARYYTAVASFKNAKDVDVSKEVWASLSAGRQDFLCASLLFLAAFEKRLKEKLTWLLVGMDVPNVARDFYGLLLSKSMARSNIYADKVKLFLNIGNSREEDLELWGFINQVEIIQECVNWIDKWIVSSYSAASTLVLFACSVGIFLHVGHSALSWATGINLFPSEISEEVGEEFKFTCLLFSIQNKKPAMEEVKAIVQDSVETVREFLAMLPYEKVELNGVLVQQFIESAGEKVIDRLGYNE